MAAVLGHWHTVIDTPIPAPADDRDDRDQWYRLAVRYAFAVDRRDADMLAELFAPDGVVALPASLTGADGETRLSPSVIVDSVQRFMHTRHVVEQQEAHRNADSTASGETYCTAHHLYRRDGTLHDYVMTIRYLDRFTLLPSGWRFTFRELVPDWTENRPVRELRK